MTYPLIRTRRFLTGMLLVIMGLNSYGCGDTATVSQPAELQSLSVSNATLEPPFSAATANYKVRVSNEVTRVTVNASPRVGGDIVRIDNVQGLSQAVDLNSPGSPKSVVIVVTENGAGGGSKTYTIDITRATLDGNNSLSNLVVSPNPLEQPFKKDTLAYTVSVPNGVSSVSVTPTLDDQAATMTVSGAPAVSGQATPVPLTDPGTSPTTTISIIVTAPDKTKKEYIVFVSRGKSGNNNLQNITLSPGTLAQPFSACTVGCTLIVPGVVANNVTSVTVTPELQDPKTATMKVNGQDTANKQARSAPLPAPGSNNSISIVVTAQNGNQQTYTVSVVRDALDGNNNLKSLTLSPGTLDKSVSACTDKCTLTVPAVLPNSVKNITVTPELQNPATATMTVNGIPTANKQAQAVSLPAPGSNNSSISIVVTAQNGRKQTYTVNVVRGALDENNNLKGLILSPGTLVQPFSTCTVNCTLNVPAVLPSSVTNITVTPELEDATATMTVNGAPTTNKQAQTTPLPVPGSSNSISIVVTAQNGSKQIYTVNAVREALASNNKLSALSVTANSVNQSVSLSAPPYTASVAAGVGTVTVTATLEDKNATLEINGQGTSSGVPSASITLGPDGSDTPIPIVVTAPNGSQKDYTVTVKKAAPTAPDKPKTAPDLITEDDSCLTIPSTGACDEQSGSTRTDNITTVKQPRFKVETPADGEIPHLYIDGKKDTGAEYNATDTTLKPSKELSDGTYKITNTVSRGDSESPKSDFLEVTINASGLGNPTK